MKFIYSHLFQFIHKHVVLVMQWYIYSKSNTGGDENIAYNLPYPSMTVKVFNVHRTCEANMAGHLIYLFKHHS